MLGDEAREEGAVDPARDVVPRRDRQKGARVVVEADGVVEAGGLGRHLAETAHAFGAVVEPPGRAELEAGIMAGERREFARIRSEAHTSELQSLMRTSYAVFCLTNKTRSQR